MVYPLLGWFGVLGDGRRVAPGYRFSLPMERLEGDEFSMVIDMFVRVLDFSAYYFSSDDGEC